MDGQMDGLTKEYVAACMQLEIYQRFKYHQHHLSKFSHKIPKTLSQALETAIFEFLVKNYAEND